MVVVAAYIDIWVIVLDKKKLKNHSKAADQQQLNGA